MRTPCTASFPGDCCGSQQFDSGQKCSFWRCWFHWRQEEGCPSAGGSQLRGSRGMLYCRGVPTKPLLSSAVSSSADPQVELLWGPTLTPSLLVLLCGHPECWHLVQLHHPVGSLEGSCSATPCCIAGAHWMGGSLSLDLWALLTASLLWSGWSRRPPCPSRLDLPDPCVSLLPPAWGAGLLDSNDPYPEMGCTGHPPVPARSVGMA